MLLFHDGLSEKMITQHTSLYRLSIFLMGLMLVVLDMSHSEAGEQKGSKLVIVTPFVSSITDKYRSVFKGLYPQFELEIIRKSTSKGVKYLLEMRNENIVDIFWASSPSSFRTLKSSDMLQPYKAVMLGVPETISGIKVSDTDNYYMGYALSGYGFMWNTHYLSINGLPIPKKWDSLGKDVYYGHIAMSTPKFSGTTHIAMESILQKYGWIKGWELIKNIVINTKKLSKKSSHVPKSIQDGESGIGIVIDYYGLTAKAKHYPVDFAYPSPAVLLPASAAITKNAPNSGAAKLFVDFLISIHGQSLLLDKNIRRIPILPATFNEAPDGYPNPYKGGKLSAIFDFDIALLTKRNHLVNEMFDALLLNNFEEFKHAAKVIHQLDGILKEKNYEGAQALLEKARQKLMWLPSITEQQSQSLDFLSSIKNSRELQSEWSKSAKQHYLDASQLAEQGLSILRNL